MRAIALQIVASLLCALVWIGADSKQSQAQFNEYSCENGQCIEAETHVINTPWSSIHTVQLGWYDLGNNVRRLGFCVNGVRTLAQSDLGYINVNSGGALQTDVSICGNSGSEKLHTWHSPTASYLQCGGGSGTAYRLRPITLSHDLVISTLNGTSSNISLYFVSTSGSDAQVTMCGGNGADSFDANVYSWMDTFGGNDTLVSYANDTAWLFAGSGNDTIEAVADPFGVYTTICNAGAGTDSCYWCDNSPNYCESSVP